LRQFGQSERLSAEKQQQNVESLNIAMFRVVATVLLIAVFAIVVKCLMRWLVVTPADNLVNDEFETPLLDLTRIALINCISLEAQERFAFLEADCR
jgi:hypothetical protein